MDDQRKQLPNVFDQSFRRLPLMTTAVTREELLAELGKLHMIMNEQDKELAKLRQLQRWIRRQAIISTPEVCCLGAELESRIPLIEFRDEMFQAGGVSER